MSADRWSVCPVCAAKELEKYHKYQDIVKNGYGKVSKEEYLYAQTFVETFEATEEPTLREDYWFENLSIDRTIKYQYSAYCEVCKLTVNLKGTIGNEQHKI